MNLRKAYARRHGFRVDANSKALARKLAHWFKLRARAELKRALRDLRSGRLTLEKNKAVIDTELLDILVQYGLRQVSAAGKRTAADLGGTWVLQPQLVEAVTREKEVLVQRLLDSVREDVRGSLRELIVQAGREKPTPSVSEIARRIRTTFHGSGGGYAKGPLVDVTEPEFGILPTALQETDAQPMYAFSPERAALIARTESAQNENTGIFRGMKIAGVDEIEWLSSGNSNHGLRRHDLMDGKTVAVGEYFTTPQGHKMRYPCDPSAPISETANCGCTFAPVMPKGKR